jgi:hypothetical protein
MVFISIIGIITTIYVCLNLRKIAYYNRLLVLSFVFLMIAPSIMELMKWVGIVKIIDFLVYKFIVIIFGLILIFGGGYSYIKGSKEHKNALVSYIKAVFIVFLLGYIIIKLITLLP